MTKKANWWRFLFFFLEFGFVEKQKGNEKQQKGKAYNLMQCDPKTRTGGGFFLFFFILVLLKNRREMRNNRREKLIILCSVTKKGELVEFFFFFFGIWFC